MAGKLTDKRIKALKATGKPYKVFDGDGLHIHVTDKGSKLWRISYRFEGKQKLISLGGYSEVSLEEARNRCTDARKMLASGVDPNAEKKRIKQTEKKNQNRHPEHSGLSRWNGWKLKRRSWQPQPSRKK